MPDIRVENHGSLFIFYLLTDRARDWWSDNVNGEDTAPPDWCGGKVVEHRYARDIALGMREDGLELGGAE